MTYNEIFPTDAFLNFLAAHMPMTSTPPPLPPATSSRPTPKPVIIPAIKTEATTESTIGVAGIGIMLANIWDRTGWSMIMYIGGISQISEDVKEAARIDGANTWQEIIYIYIPALGSVHKSLLMLGIIGSLQTYALIGVMTGGGPNHATEMPGTYIFMKGFTESQMGYACAISVAVLIFALVLTFIQVRFLGSGDFMKKGE